MDENTFSYSTYHTFDWIPPIHWKVLHRFVRLVRVVRRLLYFGRGTRCGLHRCVRGRFRGRGRGAGGRQCRLVLSPN